MDETDGSDGGFESGDTLIETGDPRLENVLFVVLGAAAMVLVLLYLIGLLLGW